MKFQVTFNVNVNKKDVDSLLRDGSYEDVKEFIEDTIELSCMKYFPEIQIDCKSMKIRRKLK